MSVNYDIKPCPFCGMAVDINDYDTLYPSGIHWYDDPDIGRVYISRNQLKRAKGLYHVHDCWVLNCVATAGGCGASITGDSAGEAIHKWQQRK